MTMSPGAVPGDLMRRVHDTVFVATERDEQIARHAIAAALPATADLIEKRLIGDPAAEGCEDYHDGIHAVLAILRGEHPWQ